METKQCVLLAMGCEDSIKSQALLSTHASDLSAVISALLWTILFGACMPCLADGNKFHAYILYWKCTKTFYTLKMRESTNQSGFYVDACVWVIAKCTSCSRTCLSIQSKYLHVTGKACTSTRISTHSLTLSFYMLLTLDSIKASIEF